jgi:hypothetical protein
MRFTAAVRASPYGRSGRDRARRLGADTTCREYAIGHGEVLGAACQWPRRAASAGALALAVRGKSSGISPAQTPNWCRTAEALAWRVNAARSPCDSDSQHKPSASASARKAATPRLAGGLIST